MPNDPESSPGLFGPGPAVQDALAFHRAMSSLVEAYRLRLDAVARELLESKALFAKHRSDHLAQLADRDRRIAELEAELGAATEEAREAKEALASMSIGIEG